MPTEPSKYAQNQFDSATVNRLPLMSEIQADTRPRLVAANAINPGFGDVLDLFNIALALWDTGETRLANAKASLPARTFAFADKLESLTRKPDADTNSPLEIWDVTIRGQVAYQGPTYMFLLPQGRETLTAGTLDEQLDAGRDFGIRLAAQITKPVLVTLGATVTTFYNAARALRVSQAEAKTELDNARDAQELLRKNCAAVLYCMVGTGMMLWKDTPDLVDSLFNVNLLRDPDLPLPEAPADTTWTPATRTLSTTAMPTSATRLAAWREGPGGMPEQLAVGESGELSVVVPATVTFDAGDLYQLWLVAMNGTGSSERGPVQSWTAV